ncbi:hypothetical protein A3J03_04410 [Candidatus Uhrbacteria bacterium RIFCSPLOWO2_02_FULL_46_25]|nr:MAG: hypothetical protein A2753_01780 [Candidatus Uhrbacteria bacterium RIFCSPHIGHO2_01_FULL_47_11]OGL67947.1 MAG: hypothetical protein A3D58_05225 [Candidatus Uhrbacteria bacterium RIFCSPHIGHO2_02_FULL_46_47]OGL84918.1 MAG: hypothetical protein A3J03_04410 [Candidatus Uhrbacteria bacterium RIFCSPLOWO2_02_FULL_46_25]
MTKHMISDAKDIFYLVLAFSVLWFTIFVCWLLYYFISIMREARGMTKDVREKINKALGIFESLKEKFERSLNVFAGIAEGVKYVGSYLMDRRGERKTTKKKKHEKKEEAETEGEEEKE